MFSPASEAVFQLILLQGPRLVGRRASQVPGFPGFHATLGAGYARAAACRNTPTPREPARSRRPEMKLSYWLRSQCRKELKQVLHSRLVLFITALLALLLWGSAITWAQDAAAFFKQNCASCHTIGGGRLTGPDLKDVTARKDRAWFVQFLQGPKA